MARTTLEADKRAFVRLMAYLKQHDPQNTVIMVQPENEVGSYRNPRDYSAAAQTLFDAAVPEALTAGWASHRYLAGGVRRAGRPRVQHLVYGALHR